MKTLTITARLDNSPEQSVSICVSSQFDDDPTDEMPGDLKSEPEVDLDTVDLDYANLYFVA